MAKIDKKKGKVSSLKASLIMDDTLYIDAEDSRNSGGKEFVKALDFSKQTVREVDKDSFHKPAPKQTFSFNIIPYIIKSDKHPLVVQGKTTVGKSHYMLDIWTHNGVGPDESSVVCLKKNGYNKSCPVCDAYEELIANADDDNAKKAANRIKAKRRAYMNIQLVEDGEYSDEVLLWNAGHYRFMAEGILQEANACRDGGAPLAFSHPTKGKVIKIRTGHSALSKKDVTVERVDFLDREEEIEDSIFEQAISFDECLVIYTPEQIEAIMEGEEISHVSKNTDDEDEDQDTEDTDTEDDTDEEDSGEDGHEDYDDEDDSEEEDDSEDDEDPVEDDDADDVEDDDEGSESEDEDEEDPEPVVVVTPKKKVVKKAPEKDLKKKAKVEKCDNCPYGHTFGEDHDLTDECEECVNTHPKCWAACSDYEE